MIIDTLVNMAEEVGVEPTRHLLSTSTALKAAASTGTHTLPNCYKSILLLGDGVSTQNLTALVLSKGNNSFTVIGP